MRAFWLTLAGLSLCLPAGAVAASFNVNGLDDILPAKTPPCAG